MRCSPQTLRTMTICTHARRHNEIDTVLYVDKSTAVGLDKRIVRRNMAAPKSRALSMSLSPAAGAASQVNARP